MITVGRTVCINGQSSTRGSRSRDNDERKSTSEFTSAFGDGHVQIVDDDLLQTGHVESIWNETEAAGIRSLRHLRSSPNVLVKEKQRRQRITWTIASRQVNFDIDRTAKKENDERSDCCITPQGKISSSAYRHFFLLLATERNETRDLRKFDHFFIHSKRQRFHFCFGLTQTSTEKTGRKSESNSIWDDDSAIISFRVDLFQRRNEANGHWQNYRNQREWRIWSDALRSSDLTYVQWLEDHSHCSIVLQRKPKNINSIGEKSRIRTYFSRESSRNFAVRYCSSPTSRSVSLERSNRIDLTNCSKSRRTVGRDKRDLTKLHRLFECHDEFLRI